MKSLITTYFKLILLISYSIVLIFFRNPMITYLLFTFTLIFLVSIRKTYIMKERVIFFLTVAVLIIISQLLISQSLSTLQRVITGLNYVVRIWSLSLIVFLFTATTSPHNIISIFSFLPKPLQLMLTMTLSLIPVISREYKNISLVQKSKGLDQNKNIFKRIFPVIIPLLHRILIRSQQIALVMESKGYNYE